MPSAPDELKRGQALQQAGQRTEARRCYERATQLDPASGHAWFLLGTLNLIEGQPASAALALQRALTLQPRFPEAQFHLGLALQTQGQPTAAIAAYRAALALRPGYVEAWGNLAAALHAQNDLPAAIAAYRETLKLRPNLPEAHNSLGVALKAHGRLDDAVASYRAALALRPDYVAAHSNLALALSAQQKWEEAVTASEAALALDPRHAPTLLTLGGILEARGKTDEAIAVNRRLIANHPNHAGAHTNLGVALQTQDKLDEAIAAYQRALALDPENAEAHTNLGTAFQAQNDLPAAIASYERALALNPDLGQTRFNLGVAQLAAGDLRSGWANYEARWQGEQGKFRRTFAQPLWHGEPLAGKTILVYPEQGLGDTLQFVRYVPLLAARGAKVVLEVQPPLRALLDGFPGASAVVTRGESLPPFDLHCPLLSLPGACGTELASIPVTVPYLRASAEKIARWQSRLATVTGPRIGLVWSGGTHHKTDRLRSIPLEMFKRVAEGSPAQFFCLQKDIREADARVLAATPKIMPLAAEIGDFSDTAALVAQLDLVITVDTSVAHLAGALGRPTWILLPFAPDWRWMLERTDSPWYPTAKLFRQSRAGDWDSVLDEVRAELGRTEAVS